MAILKTTLAEGEARYHGMNMAPGMTLPRIVRKWEFIDPTVADTLLAAAPATVVNPKVDGQTYTGTFIVKNEIGEGQDDRSITIFQTMWLDTGIAKFQSLTSTLRDDVRVIYDQYKTYVNAPADSQGNVYQAQNDMQKDGTYNAGLDYRVSNAKTTNFTSFDAQFRNTESILYDNSRTAITAPAAGAGGVYSVVGQNQKDDGTYDGRLDYDVSSNAGLYLFESLNSTLREDDTVIYKEYGLPLTAPASGHGAIYRAGNAITDRGSYNSQLDYQKSKAHTAKFDRTNSILLDRKGVTYDNQTSVVNAPAKGIGKIYDVTNSTNQDGSYDSELTYSASQPAEYSFNSRVSTGLNEITRIYSNQIVGIQGGSASQGISYNVTNNMNQDGTYGGNIRRQARTGLYHEWVSRQSGLRTDTSYLYHGTNTAVAGGAAGTGYIYNVTNSRQDDGSYNGGLAYTYNRPDSFYKQFNARYGTGFLYGFRNTSAFPDVYVDALPSEGSNSVNVRENDDKTYSGTTIYQPARNPVSFFIDFARDSFDYKTRMYPGSLTDRLARVDQWAVYRTFSTTSSAAASDCDGGYNTSVWPMGHVWAAEYSLPVSLATAWTLIA